MNDISTSLHWADQPYQWHINDGEEVFMVLDGIVEIKYKKDKRELVVILKEGGIFMLQ